MFSFEKLEVYHKSERMYKQINDQLFPSLHDKILKDQLKRACSSIVLNIAEGAGKLTAKDKKNFYVIARGSVNECAAILRILQIESRLDSLVLNDLNQSFTEIGKMLSGLIKSMTAK